MIRWICSFWVLLVSATAFAAQPLVTAAELAAAKADSKRVIIDIRDSVVPYQNGHIADAVHAPYSKWRGPKESPGRLPSNEALTALVQLVGIDSNTPVIIVYEGKSSTDFGSAARVYWTLKAAGVRDLSILNGGITAWREADLPLSIEPVTRAPSKFVVRLDPRLIATRAEVEQAVGDSSAHLLDARPAAFFDGETRHAAARTPGTIVGAKNVSHDVWFAKDATLLPADQIRQVAQQVGIQTDQPTISFCNTGHWASTNWFVLSELLGQDNVSLYPESLVEWSTTGGAMANVPGRLRQFWQQLKVASSAP